MEAIHHTAMIARIAQPTLLHLLMFVLGHHLKWKNRYAKAMAVAMIK